MALITKKNKYGNLVEPNLTIDFHDMGHGATPQMVMDCILRGITSAKGNQVKVIRLIVGKGIHSKKGAVIKPLAQSYLEKLKKQKVIKSYKYESAFGLGPNEGSILVRI